MSRPTTAPAARSLARHTGYQQRWKPASLAMRCSFDRLVLELTTPMVPSVGFWYLSVPTRETYGTAWYRVKDVVAKKTSPIDTLPPRRSAILAAAYHVLMEKGYAGASTLEIARRAKVSKRELYAEFGSKSGILEALIATTAARMQVPLAPAELGNGFDGGADFAAALVRYGVTALTELTHPAVVDLNRLGSPKPAPRPSLAASSTGRAASPTA